ncbi:putative E3 ubiquitin-protein ligase MYCBP2-like, partial [Planoprotostelium fungivorum]
MPIPTIEASPLPRRTRSSKAHREPQLITVATEEYRVDLSIRRVALFLKNQRGSPPVFCTETTILGRKLGSRGRYHYFYECSKIVHIQGQLPEPLLQIEVPLQCRLTPHFAADHKQLSSITRHIHILSSQLGGLNIMDISSIPNAEELERTREDDLTWLPLREETIVFNEVFVNSKYNEIEAQDQEKEDLEPHKKKTNRPKNSEIELAHKLIGLVEIEESIFKKNAIEQWSRELLDMCSPSGDSSFLSVLKKRLAVQQRLHGAYLRELSRKERKENVKREEKNPDDEPDYPSVPVVVRLGVLTLFPLIQSLSGIKEANYGRLCSQVLNILTNVLGTLPPLALHDEPADCLDAFQDFILSLIVGSEYDTGTVERVQAVNALVGLIMSRGKAKDLLLLSGVLFHIHERANRSLQISQYLKQLAEHDKDMELSVFFDRSLRSEFFYLYCVSPMVRFLSTSIQRNAGTWTINNMQIDSASLDSSIHDVIASDGTYLYVQSYQHGLRKIGSGYGGTIQGQIYEHNPNFRRGERPRSMVHIDGKLYYLPPHTASASVVAGATARNELEVEEYDPADLQDVDEEEEDEGEDMDMDEGVEIIPSRPVRVQAREGQVEDEEVPVQICVVDTATLTEERIIHLTEKFAPRTVMITEGRCIHFVTRKKHQGSSKDFQDLHAVQVWELTSAGDIQMVRSFDLAEVVNPPKLLDITTEDTTNHNHSINSHSPIGLFSSALNGYSSGRLTDVSVLLRESGVSIPSHKVTPETGISSVQWNKSAFYTTGYQLYVLIPSNDNSQMYNKTRVYSMIDGKHITDVKIDPRPSNSTVCYDSKRNAIWSFCDDTFHEWKNLGISPTLSSSQANITYPQYSPEAILTLSELNVQGDRAIEPLQAVLIIVANMDRLARQHPIYNEDARVMKRRISTSVHTFCIDMAGQLFEGVLNLLRHTLRHTLKEDIRAYLLLALLRVLKVNVYEVVSREKTCQNLGLG